MNVAITDLHAAAAAGSELPTQWLPAGDDPAGREQKEVAAGKRMYLIFSSRQCPQGVFACLRG